MKFDRNSLLLYAVTDRKWTSPQVSLYDQVCAAIDGGVSCVQLREKQLDESDFLAQARLIGKLCRARRVPFIINDNVELALRCQVMPRSYRDFNCAVRQTVSTSVRMIWMHSRCANASENR